MTNDVCFDQTFDLLDYLSKTRNRINRWLVKILDRLDQSRELTQAMTHSLMAGGKRLRPILGIAAAQACGKDGRVALPACCAIEMIHTYSLIHDDLPAMDDDDLRRGMPTCHKKFSEATAVLAGDALLTHAFQLLSRPHEIFDTYPEDSVLLDMIHVISFAAGVNGMVEGQMMDMQSQKMDLNTQTTGQLAHLKQIHELKTGRIISVSVATGAMSANASENVRASLAAYADLIGLAFQVMDDILNIEGDPEIMGKAAGSDAANSKLTFPALLGLAQSKQYAEQLTRDALNSLSGFDENADPLRAIAWYITHRDK